jgi:DNA-binding cell septation regulator SpoVG
LNNPNLPASLPENQALSLSIQVTNTRASPKTDGATVAYADVHIGPVLIHGVSVIKNKHGGHFVSFPSREGNKRWFVIVDIEEPARAQVIEYVLEATRQYLT